MGQAIHFLLDGQMISWLEGEFGRKDDGPIFLQDGRPIAKAQFPIVQGHHITCWRQNLGRNQDMGDFTPIGTSVHKDRSTDTAWNARSKFKACQRMKESNPCRFNQIGPCFCLHGVARNRHRIELVHSDDKATDTAIPNNDIAGIAQDHPINPLAIGKLNHADQFIAVTRKSEVVNWPPHFGIGIIFQGLIETDIDSLQFLPNFFFHLSSHFK